MRRKLLVTVTALSLAVRLGSPLGAAPPDEQQLSTIASYLESNDVEGLRGYVKVHPGLTEGNSPLAGLLRRFMVESLAAGSFFRFQPNLSDAVTNMQNSSSGSPASAY